MPIPTEVRSFIFLIALGMKYRGGGPEEWVSYALQQFGDEERIVFLAKLEKAMLVKFDAAALAPIWVEVANDLGLFIHGDYDNLMSQLYGEAKRQSSVTK